MSLNKDLNRKKQKTNSLLSSNIDSKQHCTLQLPNYHEIKKGKKKKRKKRPKNYVPVLTANNQHLKIRLFHNTNRTPLLITPTSLTPQFQLLINSKNHSPKNSSLPQQKTKPKSKKKKKTIHADQPCTLHQIPPNMTQSKTTKLSTHTTKRSMLATQMIYHPLT